VELLRDNPKISESDKELIRWRNADRLFSQAAPGRRLRSP
jgi:hypothetical protein